MGVPRARLWSFWQVAGGLAGALQPEDLNRPGGPRGCRGRGRTLRSLTLPSPSHQRHRGPCWEPGRAAWKPGLRRPGPARERLARCPEPVVTCLGPAVEKRASAGKLRVPWAPGPPLPSRLGQVPALGVGAGAAPVLWVPGPPPHTTRCCGQFSTKPPHVPYPAGPPPLSGTPLLAPGPASAVADAKGQRRGRVPSIPSIAVFFVFSFQGKSSLCHCGHSWASEGPASPHGLGGRCTRPP